MTSLHISGLARKLLAPSLPERKSPLTLATESADKCQILAFPGILSSVAVVPGINTSIQVALAIFYK
jgi:hypothetical protein